MRTKVKISEIHKQYPNRIGYIDGYLYASKSIKALVIIQRNHPNINEEIAAIDISYLTPYY